jgi:preprotein translocase subunit SecB
MSPSLPLSPLQLKEHGFTTVRVQAIEAGSVTAEPSLTPTIWFEQVPGSLNQWRLILNLQLGSEDTGKPFAYEAEIKLQGLVQVNDGFPPERKEQLALVNGFSILYSAAREMLLNITARSGNGAVTLPTISFVIVVKDATQKPETVETPSPTIPAAPKRQPRPGAKAVNG